MLKISGTLENLEFEFESIGSGNWRLTAKDNFEGTSGTKEVTSTEMACILFAMHSKSVMVQLEKLWKR